MSAAHVGAAAVTVSAAETPAIPLTTIEPSTSDEEQRALWHKAKHELICRTFALPGALLVGWLIVQTMPVLADLLRMWTHETGHAVTAWLCGYTALPTAWITIRSAERVPAASFLLAAALAFGGYVAWRLERWFWLGASAVTSPVIGRQPAQRIPGGVSYHVWRRCRLLRCCDRFDGSILCAAPESAVCRKQLRWALLVIGAIDFMDTYATWAGGFEKIVHWLDDIDERGPTDLAQLTQFYGWGIGEMQTKFLKVAHLCFLTMAAMYTAGIVEAMRHKAALQPVVRAKQNHTVPEVQKRDMVRS